MGSTVVEEVEISVPWGHISGKAWKNKGLPGIALHGLQDNAGTFDRLMPLLSPMISWVCIDFPGHGKSSHMPMGQPLEFMHLVYSVKRVVDHFNWDRFYLMGHSLGAQVALFFSSIFPERMIEVVLIDGAIPVVVEESMSANHLRNTYERLEGMERSLKNKTPPSYTYEAAVDRLMSNRPSKLTRESAEALIKRSLKPSGDGFMFSSDQRLKLFLRPLISLKQMLNIVGRVKCRILLIIAMDSYANVKSSANKLLHHTNIIKLLSTATDFNFVFVEGNHDIHLNNAPLIAEHVNNFYNIKSLL
ncbi:serine hydrolase-like protein isoform X2 [Cimex lectularius]|uniref:AB hydrolase-1 domain-containing protein n=1 Tax=Cimex lectularius TaxID=79782 RepID=A0A8I6RJI9_CIMLE|nr:serine hydrolase-like protein isoform X2 [Cimex lectularius]